MHASPAHWALKERLACLGQREADRVRSQGLGADDRAPSAREALRRREQRGFRGSASQSLLKRQVKTRCHMAKTPPRDRGAGWPEP